MNEAETSFRTCCAAMVGDPAPPMLASALPLTPGPSGKRLCARLISPRVEAKAVPTLGRSSGSGSTASGRPMDVLADAIAKVQWPELDGLFGSP